MQKSPFAKLRLDQLTKRQIEEFLDEIAPKLSERSVKAIKRFLGTAFKDAVDEGRLRTNVALNAKPQRGGYGGTPREKRCFTDEEVGRLRQAATGPYENLLTLALVTGARAGELRGLCWEAVDLDRGLIHIRQAAYDDVDGRPLLGEPKTANSKRTVTIGPSTAAVLRAMRGSRKVVRIGQPNLVFPTRIGSVIDRANFQRWSARLFDTAEVDGTFHGLRHTFITKLVQSGKKEPAEIARIVGHDLETLYRYYYHHSDAPGDAGQFEAMLLAEA